MAEVKQKTELYYCPHCPLTTNFKGNLVRHQRVHTGEMPFKCDLCQRAFRAKEALIKHRIAVHEGRNPLNGKYRCDECNVDFSQPASLNLHMKSLHSGIDVFSIIVYLYYIDERPFACDKCEYRSKTKLAMRLHMDGHSSERYACPICSKTFKYAHIVPNHIR